MKTFRTLATSGLLLSLVLDAAALAAAALPRHAATCDRASDQGKQAHPLPFPDVSIAPR